MRVFVTGGTGFIGFAIVKELISAGHQATGLARSSASAKKLTDAGATALQGAIENLDILRRGAGQADGVIHTAFFHEITQMPLGTRLGVMLGGAPSGIVSRFTKAAVDADRNALETMGEALRGQGLPLVGTFATLAMKPGQVATEDDSYDPKSEGGPRGATEGTMRVLASRGVRATIIRLPPIVHGEGDRGGFVPRLIKIARKQKNSAYVMEGRNRWGAVHRLDAARLFRLTLEKGSAGAAYHGVAEQGIPFRDIAGAIGKRLQVSAVSKSPAEAAKQFSFLSSFIPVDNPVSSALTQERLGWHPAQPDLLSELQQSFYFSA